MADPNEIEVYRVDDCDVSVGGHRYCTGQFTDPKAAAVVYALEAARMNALAMFLHREGSSVTRPGSRADA